MADRERMVMDLLCGKLQTQWSYCNQSCVSCKFYHEEYDMGVIVPICVHGFGSRKESCGCYMTQHEYLEFVRSGFASLEAENVKLRKIATEAIRLMQADGPDCELCNHFDECWTGEAMNYSPSGCVICNNARKLGVKV